jgi:hypothetical protein
MSATSAAFCAIDSDSSGRWSLQRLNASSQSAERVSVLHARHQRERSTGEHNQLSNRASVIAHLPVLPIHANALQDILPLESAESRLEVK